MWGDGEHNLVFLPLFVFLPEEVFENWNLRKPRVSRQGMGFGVFEYPAHQVNLSVLQASFVLDAALSDDWLADSANILRSAHRGDFE